MRLFLDECLSPQIALDLAREKITLQFILEMMVVVVMKITKLFKGV